jgi:hypothetical protein
MLTKAPHRSIEECVAALEAEIKRLKERVRLRDEATALANKDKKS